MNLRLDRDRYCLQRRRYDPARTLAHKAVYDKEQERLGWMHIEEEEERGRKEQERRRRRA